MIIQLLTNQADRIAPYISVDPIVIVIQSGIYSTQQLIKQYPSLRIYALTPDVLASGLELNSSVTCISANEWVDLCALNHPVITLQ